MSQIEEKLHALGHALPPAPGAAGNYLPFRRSGNLLFLAGSISVKADGTLIQGKAGAGCTVEEGYESARVCALNQLAVIKAALGSLDGVRQILTISGYVNAAPDFTEVPQVINGASDLLVELFGDAGRHARAAVGVASLPKGALTEVQMVVEAVEERH
jgi:enamine deaminase RidA (YjgF/YER057c/UK114 family)